MHGEDPLVAQCQKRVGTLINGKYRLDALIGVGGMAAVYMATHRNGSLGAVKLLHEEVARNEEVRQRFLREAYIANKVGHEGTVKVIDDDVDEQGAPFIVMELLQGAPLDVLAEQAGGQLSVEQTLDIVDQTLAVLEAAHRNNIVHRDLKPENLFLTNQGVVKVLDFGIARLREDNARKTQTGMVMGTPSFMAPEQAMGRWSDVDGRTDLYAVGATAFTLLSGHMVHEAETAGEMMVAAATRPARSLARVLQDAPFALVALIDKALAYERDQRFVDAAAFRQALNDVRNGESQTGAGANSELSQSKPKVAATVVLPNESDAGPKQVERLLQQLDTFDPSDNTAADIEALVEVFTMFERSLVAIKQYGEYHPEPRRRLNETFRKLAGALMSCDVCLAWNLTPYGFVAGERLIWEPEPPWNRVPYQLFSDGIRTMGFAPGLDEEEFAQWVRIVTLDPAEDFSPEDDMVTQLWDADFTHAFHQAIDTFAEGNQQQRAQYEADRKAVVEGARFLDASALTNARRASQRVPQQSSNQAAQQTLRVLHYLKRGEGVDPTTAARVKNMTLVDPTDVAHADAKAALEMDSATRSLLATRLEIDVGNASERFVYAAAQAFIASARAGRSTAVSAPLKRAVDGLASDTPTKAIEMILSLRNALTVEGKDVETQELRALLTSELMSSSTLLAILQGSNDLPKESLDAYLGQTREILKCIQPQHFSAVLDFLPHSQPGELRELLVRMLGREGSGHEAEIAKLFTTADEELGLSLVRILAAIETDAAKQAIASASKSPYPLVRIEALGHLEGVSGTRLREELRKLLEDPNDDVRLAALQQMESHKIAAAGPFLVVRIQEKAFLKLPFVERRQSLQTLRTLKVQRCEEVCVALLRSSSWLRGDSVESTRELAAEFLGEIARTNDAFFTLESIAKSKDVRNSKAVRTAAEKALTAISDRASRAEAARNRQESMDPRSSSPIKQPQGDRQ